MIRSLDGKMPKVHPTAFVSEFAYVVGDVEIGEGSSIWPGAVVRADSGKITIGKQTCIQDNSVVHGDADVVIGDNVVVGHGAVCHARKVGDRVLVGNGATVNDGVEIGEDSLIAAGAVVLDKTVVPAGSHTRHATFVWCALDVRLIHAPSYTRSAIIMTRMMPSMTKASVLSVMRSSRPIRR